MDAPTTFKEIETSFHAMPLTKKIIAEELEKEWLKTAIADYELDLGCNLQYNETECVFADKLENYTIRILALMMYTCYLQRELSRVMALNGFYGKDIQITGSDSTKRVTKQEFDDEINRVNQMLHKLKTHCYD